MFEAIIKTVFCLAIVIILMHKAFCAGFEKGADYALDMIVKTSSDDTRKLLLRDAETNIDKNKGANQ